MFTPEDSDLLDSVESDEEEPSDDSSDFIGASNLNLELSEDPVRLYLKEIGQIDLLTAESEFRLATRNEAKKRLDWLLERDGENLAEDSQIQTLFCQIMKDLLESYKNLQAFWPTQPGPGAAGFCPGVGGSTSPARTVEKRRAFVYARLPQHFLER